MRLIQEQWLAAGYSIEHGEQQKMTPEGLPLMSPEGMPETEKVTVLVIVRQYPHERHEIRIPFGDEQKRKLVSDLSGGIVLAGQGGPLDGFKL